MERGEYQGDEVVACEVLFEVACFTDHNPSFRVKLTTAAPHSQTYEGSLFTACPILNIVAINTRSASANVIANAKSEPGDYHVIPVSRIQSFQILSLASGAENGANTFATAQPLVGPVDVKRLEERERAKINKLKEAEQNRGKGVTKEAQAIYDAFKRMCVERNLYLAQIRAGHRLMYALAICPFDGTTTK